VHGQVDTRQPGGTHGIERCRICPNTGSRPITESTFAELCRAGVLRTSDMVRPCPKSGQCASTMSVPVSSDQCRGLQTPVVGCRPAHCASLFFWFVLSAVRLRVGPPLALLQHGGRRLYSGAEQRTPARTPCGQSVRLTGREATATIYSNNISSHPQKEQTRRGSQTGANLSRTSPVPQARVRWTEHRQAQTLSWLEKEVDSGAPSGGRRSVGRRVKERAITANTGRCIRT
jgi:hypothetical protein